MKKLNRKGFTLVELLAVIIILAIVVGITIPAVLTTTNKAKEKAFQTAADSAADWFDRQYQVALTGLNGTGIATLDSNFSSANGCGSNGTNCLYTETTNADGTITKTYGKRITESTVMAAAGLKSANVSGMRVIITPSTGRTCVILLAKDGGDYAGAGTDNYTETAGTTKEKALIMSSNCSGYTVNNY